MSRYLTSREWAADKASITRAKKKGPESVRITVRAILRRWDATDTVWPDDWAHLDRCLSDAFGWPAPTVDDILRDLY